MRGVNKTKIYFITNTSFAKSPHWRVFESGTEKQDLGNELEYDFSYFRRQKAERRRGSERQALEKV
jgi:hypothetical protein